MKNIRRQGQRKKERKKERKKGEGKAGRERMDGWRECVCVCEDFSFLIAYWTR